MFNKIAVGAALLLVVLPAGAFQKTQGQEAGAAKAAPEAARPENAYRLDFSVNELEDGKKINTRQYSMNLNSNYSNEVKIGTRVPVETGKEGEFQYLDVGTNIWSRLDDRSGQVDLEVRAEISNFALPDQGQQGQSSRPVIRQLKISGGTLATLGKPMVVGSVDDPNSKRQFQLEVTVTKLR
ncbi:MAG TPA: hypothetical protein VIW68_02990 [Candidatus Sulfotelmatobacter sp.]